MARRCELTGKSVLTGNNVSHSNVKSKRRFLPNLNIAKLSSDMLGRSFRFRISSNALRTIDHVGGLDAYLLKARDEVLSTAALKVKKDLVKANEAKQV